MKQITEHYQSLDSDWLGKCKKHRWGDINSPLKSTKREWVAEAKDNNITFSHLYTFHMVPLSVSHHFTYCLLWRCHFSWSVSAGWYTHMYTFVNVYIINTHNTWIHAFLCVYDPSLQNLLNHISRFCSAAIFGQAKSQFEWLAITGD